MKYASQSFSSVEFFSVKYFYMMMQRISKTFSSPNPEILATKHQFLLLPPAQPVDTTFSSFYILVMLAFPLACSYKYSSQFSLCFLISQIIYFNKQKLGGACLIFMHSNPLIFSIMEILPLPPNYDQEEEHACLIVLVKSQKFSYPQIAHLNRQSCHFEKIKLEGKCSCDALYDH